MCTLRRILLAASAALLLTTAVPARAETTAQASARLGTILGRAGITGTNQTYVLTLLPLFANGGTFTNGTNNAFVLAENSEDLTLTFGTNLLTLASTTGATFVLTPATTISGDLTLSGAAGALTFNSASSSIVTTDNSATGLVLGSTGTLAALTLDTRDSAEGLIISGYATVGTTLGVTGDLTLSGAAGALTFGAASSSVLVTDNSTTGLDIGSTGTTAGLRYDSTDNNENLVVNSAGLRFVGADITGTIALDGSDCGKHFAVTLAGATTITLPDADAYRGCTVGFTQTAADGGGGVLLDITPLDSDADGIIGGCYETATDTIIDFSGTADADIGLTAASSQQGDYIELNACGDALWCVLGCRGIWANN